jgi:hypothetical protein
MAASFDEEMALISVSSQSSQCLVGDREKVDLSRLLPMLSPGTWAASSQVIGELEQHQDLVVFDIQTSKPFEAWLMLTRAETMMLLRHWSTNLAEQLTLILERLHQIQNLGTTGPMD